MSTDRTHAGPAGSDPDGDLRGAAADVADGDGSGSAPRAATAPCQASSPSSSALSTRLGAPVALASRATSSWPLRRLAAGRGDEHLDRGAAQLAGAAHMRRRGLGRLLELLLRDRAGALDLLAESELDAILAHGDETVAVARGHQQPHGIRPHVDDPDPHARDSGPGVGRRPPQASQHEVSAFGRLLLGVVRVHARCA